MSPFENIVDAIHGLSHEEKFKLRLLLDAELRPQNAAVKNEPPSSKRIIGLFADEPELIDQVMQAVYERRSRPMRLDPQALEP